MKNKWSGYDDRFKPYYKLQSELSKKVIKEDRLSQQVSYIAGADVAYDDDRQKMVGAIVVLDANTMEVVDQAHHEMVITFPYVPGLFSFREIPPLKVAFEQLTINPNLIICDGHGIAHPLKMGMATHLGIELNVPTIGCGKKRLIGDWEKSMLGLDRGAEQPLILEGATIGKVLRTQNNIKPVFVSIGHMVSLDAAVQFVLKMCKKYRLPETTRAADQLVNQLMKSGPK